MNSGEQLSLEVNEHVPKFVVARRLKQSQVCHLRDGYFVNEHFEYILIEALLVEHRDDLVNEAFILLENGLRVFVITRSRYLIES